MRLYCVCTEVYLVTTLISLIVYCHQNLIFIINKYFIFHLQWFRTISLVIKASFNQFYYFCSFIYSFCITCQSLYFCSSSLFICFVPTIRLIICYILMVALTFSKYEYLSLYQNIFNSRCILPHFWIMRHS